MENATFISDRMDSVLVSDTPLKEKLSAISAIIYELFAVRTQFCAIYGKRWAYFSGIDDGAVITMARIPLGESWGMIADGVPGNENGWRETIEKLREYLINLPDED